MNESQAAVSTGQLVLVPALISLGITLLRLVGELNRWSPTFFNREPGGPGALVGIVWLVPVFGLYFAWRLSAAGRGPKSRGRALGYALAGLLLFVVLYLAVARLVPSLLGRVVLINCAAAISALVAYRGWPELGLTEVAYGLAARIPVALVMLVAMAANWGTHYEFGPPGFPELGLLPKWLAIGLMPQLVFWVGFTVLVGSLFGGLVPLVRRAPRGRDLEPAPSR
jgi:hypothetical protein